MPGWFAYRLHTHDPQKPTLRNSALHKILDVFHAISSRRTAPTLDSDPTVSIAILCAVVLLALGLIAVMLRAKRAHSASSHARWWHRTCDARCAKKLKNPHGYANGKIAEMCPFMHGTVHTCPYPGYRHGTHPEVCPDGCVPCAPPAEEAHEKLLREAQEFMTIFAHETGRDKSAFVAARMATIVEEASARGEYELSHEELEFGAQLAWRNAPKCANRAKYQELSVMDCRDAGSNDDVFEAMLSLVDAGVSSGATVTRMAVFRPKRPEETQGPRVWNSMLFRYAGYKLPDGQILGDPADAELTEVLIKQFGWVPPEPKSAWDVLPLLIQLDETSPPELFELPSSHLPTVPIRHPTKTAFNELRLGWFGLPLVCGMELNVGGLSFTCAPFLGWFADYEVVRNLTDPSRLNLCAVVAKAVGLDTSTQNELWMDQAMMTVTEAVVHSYRSAGFAMVSRHTMLNEFVDFYEKEKRQRGFCPVNWKWVVPPIGGTLTKAYLSLNKATEFTLLPAILPPRVLGKPAGWKHFDLGIGPARTTMAQVHRSKRVRVPAGKRWRSLRPSSSMLGMTLGLMRRQRPLLLILYATVSGTASRQAARIASLLSQSFVIISVDLAHFSSRKHATTIADASLVLVVTSTYGSGAAPPTATDFLQWIRSHGAQQAPTADGVESTQVESAQQAQAQLDAGSVWGGKPFAVLGLGSSAFPRFCAAADTFTAAMLHSGAVALLAEPGRIDALGEGERAFAAWLSAVTHAFSERLLAAVFQRLRSSSRVPGTPGRRGPSTPAGRRQLCRLRTAPRHMLGSLTVQPQSGNGTTPKRQARQPRSAEALRSKPALLGRSKLAPRFCAAYATDGTDGGSFKRRAGSFKRRAGSFKGRAGSFKRQGTCTPGKEVSFSLCVEVDRTPSTQTHSTGERPIRREGLGDVGKAVSFSRKGPSTPGKQGGVHRKTAKLASGTSSDPEMLSKTQRRFIANYYMSHRARALMGSRSSSAAIAEGPPFNLVKMMGASSPPTSEMQGGSTGTVLAMTSLVYKPPLTQGELPRATVQLTVDTSAVPGGALYSPGDNVAVYPRSSAARVTEAAMAYGIEESELDTVWTLEPKRATAARRAASSTSMELADPLETAAELKEGANSLTASSEPRPPFPYSTPTTLRDVLTLNLDHEARPTVGSLEQIAEILARRARGMDPNLTHRSQLAPTQRQRWSKAWFALSEATALAKLKSLLTWLLTDGTGDVAAAWLKRNATTWPALFNAMVGLKGFVRLSELLWLIPSKHPRYYSVASSLKYSLDRGPAGPQPGRSESSTFDLIVGLQGSAAHPGQSSSFLHSLTPGERLNFRIISVPAFRLPISPLAPCVCICAGTGFAPLRGFIQERQYHVSSRERIERRRALRIESLRHESGDCLTEEQTLLPRRASSAPSTVAGEATPLPLLPRRSSTAGPLAPLVLVGGYRTEDEILCKDEIDSALTTGAITAAHFAISRPEPPAKGQYIQDVIMHNEALRFTLRTLLADRVRYPNATVFICGEANMAAAVGVALEQVIGKEAYSVLLESGHIHEEIFGAK